MLSGFFDGLGLSPALHIVLRELAAVDDSAGRGLDNDSLGEAAAHPYKGLQLLAAVGVAAASVGWDSQVVVSSDAFALGHGAVAQRDDVAVAGAVAKCGVVDVGGDGHLRFEVVPSPADAISMAYQGEGVNPPPQQQR